MRMAQLLASLLACGLVGCGPHWRVVESSDGAYTVELPGAPEVIHEEVQTPFGPAHREGLVFLTGRLSRWTLSWNALYFVWSTKWPDRAEGISRQAVLDWERDRLVELGGRCCDPSQSATFEESSTNVDGHPGRAVLVRSPGTDVERLSRLVFVENRSYVLAVSDSQPELAERFLSSLAIH